MSNGHLTSISAHRIMLNSSQKWSALFFQKHSRRMWKRVSQATKNRMSSHQGTAKTQNMRI